VRRLMLMRSGATRGRSLFKYSGRLPDHPSTAVRAAQGDGSELRFSGAPDALDGGRRDIEDIESCLVRLVGENDARSLAMVTRSPQHCSQ
jgi:hypothetical protein